MLYVILLLAVIVTDNVQSRLCGQYEPCGSHTSDVWSRYVFDSRPIDKIFCECPDRQCPSVQSSSWVNGTKIQFNSFRPEYSRNLAQTVDLMFCSDTTIDLLRCFPGQTVMKTNGIFYGYESAKIFCKCRNDEPLLTKSLQENLQVEYFTYICFSDQAFCYDDVCYTKNDTTYNFVCECREGLACESVNDDNNLGRCKTR